MISRSSCERFWRDLGKGRRFLITTHVNPDGDGLASMLVFAMVLKALKKDYYIVMEDLFPEKYRFLLYNYAGLLVPEYIHVPSGYRLSGLLPGSFKPDSLIIIDTHALQRLGGFAAELPGLGLRHVFLADHHRGRIRLPHTRTLVDPSASSTGEILYGLLKTVRFRITKSMAELLYIAIVTDTKNFSQSNTTARTHLIASDLLRTGLKPEEVSYYFQETPAETLKVFARVIARLRTAYDGQVVWSFIRKSELGRCMNADVDGLIEMMRNVKGARAAILFKEVAEGQVKVCLRGKRNFNVFRIARKYSGGGHLQAAGFIVKGKLQQGISRVLRELKSHL